MPNHVYENQEFSFVYDPVASANEGRSVTNLHHIGHTFNFSILCPSGTGGLQLWINNRRFYDQIVTDPESLLIDQFNYALMSTRNIPWPTFSAAWVNITTDPCVTTGPSAFYINQTARFVRIQGSSLTGSSSTGPVSYLWTSNSEPGR